MGSIIRPEATLEERWEARTGPVLLTGTHALVRLPMLRQEMDAAEGFRTGGFISGYRGSPLGAFDRELARQAERLRAHDVVFQPGLNEDLAATAIWGSQQVHLTPGARLDGVFGIWYGKGPGVDRSGDVLRHANSAGSAPHGGVLALVGDDPSSKSSTITSGCEYAFMDLEIPMLDPADVGEVLEYGLKGIALSRYAGTWVGMKCVADTMDATMTVMLDPALYTTREPQGLPAPPDGVHIRATDTPMLQEERLRHVKLPRAIAFARTNGIDRMVLDSADARFGIVVRGKAFTVLRQALAEAGISEDFARAQGLRIWKVGLAWPLDAEAARAFAEGLDEILVIEDRRSFVEWQLRDALFHMDRRPRITGKRDEAGRPLLSDLSELDSAAILRALFARLPQAFRTNAMLARMAALQALAEGDQAPVHGRDPYFCPGCPHNTSTRVPEGSRALAGIGCHYLARFMNRDTDFFCQMGGEGSAWIGQEHFTSQEHIFANMGDGTYAHSGSLSVRFAVASKANITFKILVNSAVAMTGGQTPEGEIDVPHIAAQLHGEGVGRIEIVSDDPDRHRGHPLIPASVGYHHRARLDAVQQELRAVKGVTAIIYDQECATERRRKRKRDLAPRANRRIAINPRICEDCGDCSRASNCLAVEPIETPFGRKRRIDQSACNQDFSCVEGFCPSFVSLIGAEPARPGALTLPPLPPEPSLPAIQGEAWNLLIAGVGGQGVSSMAAILAQAAHLEGRPVRTLDFLGLAQKGGGVYAQLRIGPVGAAADQLSGARIAAGEADLLLAADMVVAHGRTARPLLGPARSTAIVNADLSPTAQFVKDTETRYDNSAMLQSLRAACHDALAIPALSRVERDLGDAIYLNPFMLGFAWQRGLVPLSAEAILRAFELNGAAVERNKNAFALGRIAATETPAAPRGPETLDDIIARYTDDLKAYQSSRYARRYQDFVARIRTAEAAALPGEERLTRAVARQLYRLMAYKDEYEVARLHSLPEWRDSLARGFAGTQRIEVHLAPPIISKINPDTGLPEKRAFGPGILRAMNLLRHGKILRGTWLDPFARTTERREERALPSEYRAGLEALLPKLSPATHGAICDWAEAAAGIKGFGHVKARNLAATRARMADIAKGIFSMSAVAFDLPEETRALQSVARDFARDVLAPKALQWDKDQHFPVAEMREAAALGMAALYVREESGGAGLTRLDAAVVFEALATGCPTISAFMSIHNMVAWMIDRFGNDAQRGTWLPKLISMEAIASYCLTEPGSGSDAAALKGRASRDNQGYVLNGTKQFISGAGASDLYLTMLRTGGDGPGGVSALLIPKDTPGLSFGAVERKMGWNAQPTRQVILEDARVGAEALLGAEGQGFRFAMAGLDGGRLNIAACSLGGAEAALDIALRYTQERRAFGKAISDFQNTQFKLADMRIELEAARALLWRACAKLDGGEPDATMFCAMAKRFVTDTASRVADDALQLLGGYGYLAEYGIEKIVRDLRVHRILEGTNEIMRLIVARKMLGG